jgi:hypothetical protein
MLRGEWEVEEVPKTVSMVGVSVEEAGDIATNNAIVIGLGTVGMFYLIYKFLIK